MGATTLRIAWRSLWRSKRRTALALLAIGIGQWALLVMQGLTNGYAANVQDAVTGPMVGHIQIHHPDYREKRAMDLVIPQANEATLAMRRDADVTQVSPRIYAAALLAPLQDAYVATVVGIDPAFEAPPNGMLPLGQARLRPGEIMVGERLARRSGCEVGMEVALLGAAADGSLANDLFTVVAIVDSPVEMVNQSGVLMRLEDAQAFLVMADEVHELVLRSERLQEVDPLAARLRLDPRLDGLSVETWRQIAPELVLVIDMIGYANLFVLALVMIAALAGIVNTLLMSTYERMPEFGMLLALGSSPWRIVRLILVEAWLLGSVGAALGTAAGWTCVAYFGSHGVSVAKWGGQGIEDLAYGGLRLSMDIYPRLHWDDPWLGIVAIMLVSLLAAAWPAAAAGRLEPMEAMHA